jgi:hypothetical protein
MASRELDHLYSVKFMNVDRNSPLVNRALNCALISSATNRNKSGEPPSRFIAKRAEAANLGADTVRWRLATHLVPYDALIGDNYDNFLEARARLIEADMKALCTGAEPVA